MNQFKKAERTKIKIKIAMTGPSGSGKTYSALLLAKGMGGKIALIDTENGSSALYSDNFDFDVLSITPPFTTEKYVETIQTATRAGYEILVIDSISHAWAGEGGLLEQKEQMDQRGGSGFANWGKITKKHEAFKAAILHSEIHLIATMRSKQEYVLSQDDKGKQRIMKMGMAPVQREGMEYEFTTVFDIAMNHEAEASKDRTGLFADKIFKINEQTGRDFMDWLGTAKSTPTKTPLQKAIDGEIPTYRVGIGGPNVQGKTLMEVYGEFGYDRLKKYMETVKSKPKDQQNNNEKTFIFECEIFLIKQQFPENNPQPTPEEQLFSPESYFDSPPPLDLDEPITDNFDSSDGAKSMVSPPTEVPPAEVFTKKPPKKYATTKDRQALVKLAEKHKIKFPDLNDHMKTTYNETLMECSEFALHGTKRWVESVTVAP